ncbi:SCO family protein [Chitinilyticum litopenaei]|uniref:SCO family protein n=2 Tax=Chitinilyticum piscinae TaxID=2866724 RepID=A0A8J7FL87_9NEIS|nr:SCO family protein [Chitinilyticum piscinae]
MLAGLTACGPSAQFQGVDLSEQRYGGDFTLIDGQGKPRTLSSFKGKVVVLFFGYTQCPDVCPTTLAELRDLLPQFGAAARDIQVLFVSVDPARDTPELLAQYVPAFHPDFLGLTGSASAVAQVARQYGVAYQRRGEGEHYTMDHTAGTYLLDRQGRVRVMINYGSDPSVLRHDLQLLLEERAD